jgi:hypothetical protein
MINRAFLASFDEWIDATLPLPMIGVYIDLSDAPLQVQRAAQRIGRGAPRLLQRRACF